MLNRFSRKFFSILRERQNLLVTLKNNNETLLIQLNRPKALNALCNDLISELNETLTLCNNDHSIKTVVITGSERAFAAGADIKEMSSQIYSEVYLNQMLADWDKVSEFR